MTKYEVIEKIMGSKHVDENDKVFFIESFLKGWITVDDIKWLWEAEP